MTPYYDINGNEISREEGLELLGARNAERQVMKSERDGVRVSTVHLVIDHGGHGNPFGPIIFETMIFGGDHDEEQWRYKTLAEAREGHKQACNLAFGLVGGGDE